MSEVTVPAAAPATGAAAAGKGAVVIEADKLTTGYGKADVLTEVSLIVRAGEVVALLGANGAGKTTLLRSIAGHMPVRNGEVRLFGERCTWPAHRRARAGLAYIGDDRHTFPGLTVSQNMRLVDRDVEAAAEWFPRLAGLAGRRAALLSGGEQQMLSLARALSGSPRVIVVDELSLGLAPLVRDQLLALLRRCADDGAAVLLVEQSVESVLEVADRAYVLRRGSIVDERAASGWVGALGDLGDLYLS